MFGYLDCSSGVSGDKLLGAIVDAGLSADILCRHLDTLPIAGWRLRAEHVKRAGLAGTLVSVEASDEQPSRSWHDIEVMLHKAQLPGKSRNAALRAFRLLAEAEADAHGVKVRDVHFHEVGAIDSIVDVVGTAIGLSELGIDELWATPVCVGSGTVETAHGTLPVPAPATARLLVGVPTYAGPIEGEMTTPTGAALLRAFVTRYAPMPPLTATALGHGAGSRDLEVPNLLRLTVGERQDPNAELEQVAVLESAIDHVAPETLADALELVLEAGALDVWQAPIVMKKGRLASAVTVMARPQDASRLSDELMRQTGTLGVRRTLVWRSVAERHGEVSETPLGAVRMKVAEPSPGAPPVARPEADDVEAVARRTGMAIKDVAARLAKEAAHRAERPQAPAPEDEPPAAVPEGPGQPEDPHGDLEDEETGGS